MKKFKILSVFVLSGLMFAFSFLAYAQETNEQPQMSGELYAINFKKTVGTDSQVCASTKSIIADYGDTVYYCYEIENTGLIPLTRHDLIDSEIGVILSGFPFTLQPSARAWISQSVVATSSVINTATWTAYNPGPVDVVSQNDFAAITVINAPTIYLPLVVK